MEEEGGEKKKSILRAVGIETVFIGVIILIIVGTLIYLNIIPLSKFFPGQKTSPFPLKGRDLSRVISPTSIPTPAPVNAQINVVSDIPDYSITLNNKEDILSILKKWDVYGKIYGADLYNSVTPQPLEKITIHLTDQEQKLFAVRDNNGIYISSGITFKNNSSDLYVYIKKSILEDSKKNIDRLLLIQALTTLYGASNQVNSVDKLNEATKLVSTTVSELEKKQNTYFKIVKK